jgi:hemolysin III
MYRGERLNGYSHLAGALLALPGVAVLLTLAAQRGDPWRIVSLSIYGATLVLLFTISTLYHSVRGRAKNVLRKLDHSAIYLLIAGTYTPFTLVSLNGAWGWSLFGVIWGLAVFGIVQEVTIARGARWLSLGIYLVMGWLAVVAVVPLARALSWNGMGWVAAGGLVYTAGIVFYVFDERFRHWHGIWHFFVMGGSATHFAAIAMFIV